MSKLYKELRTCQMCKKKFVLHKEEARSGNSSYFYCPECYARYCKDKKNSD